MKSVGAGFVSANSSALVGVVHADTENLPRLINGRQKADFRFAMVRLVVSEGSRLIEASPREEIFQVNS